MLQPEGSCPRAGLSRRGTLIVIAFLIRTCMALHAASASVTDNGSPQGKSSTISSSSHQYSEAADAFLAESGTVTSTGRGSSTTLQGLESEEKSLAGPLDACAYSKESVCFHLRNHELGMAGPSSPKEGQERTENKATEEYTCVCLRQQQQGAHSVVVARGGCPCQEEAATAVQEQNRATSVSSSSTYPNNSSGKMLFTRRRNSSLEAKQQEETTMRKRRLLLKDTRVLRILARYALNGWSEYPEEAVRVEHVSGGLSNKLLMVTLNTDEYLTNRGPCHAPSLDPNTHDDSCPRITKALLRVYGNQDGASLFVPQEEMLLFKVLGRIGIAPQCLSEFEGGRIESFIEGDVLSTSDLTLQPILELVVRAAAYFHTTSIASLDHRYADYEHWKALYKKLDDGNMSYSSSILHRLDDWGRLAQEAVTAARQQAEAADNATTTGMSVQFVGSQQMGRGSLGVNGGKVDRLDDDGGPELMSSTMSRINALNLDHYIREGKWLREKLISLAEEEALFFGQMKKTVLENVGADVALEVAGKPNNLRWLSGTAMVLSHNDYQENNIMRTPDGTLKLIDFEYSGPNFRAFDVGNLFCEATLDYTNNPNWPFYSHIPTNMPSLEMRKHLVRVYLTEVLHIKNLTVPQDLLITEEVVRRFLRVVDYMMLASHLMWGYWSITRAEIPETQDVFSYLNYAKTRFESYDHKRREMMEAG